MKITMIGTGYVGLVVGACLAETGNDVICADLDQAKIDGLKQNILPIYEPGLKELLSRNRADGRIRFTNDACEAVEHGDILFIAVGTPPAEDGSADLGHVLSVAATIGRHLKGFKLVVNKSTVPVGTADKVRAAISHELVHRGMSPDLFDVVSNPEFLKEGAAIDDFMRPDRIVVGVASERAETVMQKLYKPFLMNGHPLIFMDIPSAEMTKYAANAMLASCSMSCLSTAEHSKSKPARSRCTGNLAVCIW